MLRIQVYQCDRRDSSLREIVGNISLSLSLSPTLGKNEKVEYHWVKNGINV